MIVTTARVLIELGSTGGTAIEAAILSTIPQAESKYRQIAGFGFETEFEATFVDGESTFTMDTSPDSIIFYLVYGQLIDGEGVAAETFITAINLEDGIVTVNNAFTADGDKLTKCQQIEYWPVISSMINYMMNQRSITAQNKKDVKSKRVGPLSTTHSDSAINARWGLPENIVQAIPKFARLK